MNAQGGVRSLQKLLTGVRKRILEIVYPPSSGGGLRCAVVTVLVSVGSDLESLGFPASGY